MDFFNDGLFCNNQKDNQEQMQLVYCMPLQANFSMLKAIIWKDIEYTSWGCTHQSGHIKHIAKLFSAMGRKN